MKILRLVLFLLTFYLAGKSQVARPIWKGDTLGYHRILVDPQDGSIRSWVNEEPGKSYDFVIQKTWDFWVHMRMDKNGLPYYMNHQVWRPDFSDRRGIGGDQFAMALSSWNLLYAYTGQEAVKEEMKFMADYYLTHSLSPTNASWPNIPYPYNTLIYSGVYDGDMILGQGFTQPDKAGSFALELVKLYKMTYTKTATNITDKRYLDAAVKIANTLCSKIKNGDDLNSPLPFKVHALTGEVGQLTNRSTTREKVQLSCYTSNWSPTMELLLSLIALKVGHDKAYQQSFDILLNWMKNYPLKTNKWGPFFEDVSGWSDTQINAISFAQFMMNHQSYFPNWKSDVKQIFSWVYGKLGNKEWERYGVVVMNEQTAYQTPGNSHSTRQASAELQYASLTGDTLQVQNAIRQLNWATYMVDQDGKNCYPRDEIWMTDGYGDYVRHYLRAMGDWPSLSPSDQSHLLHSTSVIKYMEYPQSINKFLRPDISAEDIARTLVNYRTFDMQSTELIRLTKKPSVIKVNEKILSETHLQDGEGWSWKALKNGGLLRINHKNGNQIVVMGTN
jgi:hypothetical protein